MAAKGSKVRATYWLCDSSNQEKHNKISIILAGFV